MGKILERCTYTARKDTDGLWTEMLLTLISEQRLIYVLKVVG